MRHAVMTGDDRDALWAWVQTPSGEDDPAAWKQVLGALDFRDPRRSRAAAQVGPAARALGLLRGAPEAAREQERSGADARDRGDRGISGPARREAESERTQPGDPGPDPRQRRLSPDPGEREEVGADDEGDPWQDALRQIERPVEQQYPETAPMAIPRRPGVMATIASARRLT